MTAFAPLLDDNNALAALSRQAGPRVTNAVYSASQKTGVDFAYLLNQAKVESSFDTDAQAKTSSARGLYQFIERTWLDMVERHGDKYGIDTNASRSELLKLRDDPKLASAMAAEFASENKQFLDTHWAKGQKEIGSTELYLAHFMGASGAAAFLNARDANPLQPAADLFPAAANANKNVFYDRTTGRVRSLAEVYGFFDQKFDGVESPSSNIQFAAYKRNSTVPLRSFEEKLALEDLKSTQTRDILNIFSSLALPEQNKMLRMETLDFISLIRSI